MNIRRTDKKYHFEMNLTESEVIDLKLAVEFKLETFLPDVVAKAHPDSHVGHLKSLRESLYAVFHGSYDYNKRIARVFPGQTRVVPFNDQLDIEYTGVGIC